MIYFLSTRQESNQPFYLRDTCQSCHLYFILNQVVNFILGSLQIITDLCTMSGELKKKG